MGSLESNAILRCNVCRREYAGKFAAELHALKTSHVDFIDVTEEACRPNGEELAYPSIVNQERQNLQSRRLPTVTKASQQVRSIPLVPIITQETLAKEKRLKDAELRIKRQKENEENEKARILRNIALDKERRKQKPRDTPPSLPPASTSLAPVYSSTQTGGAGALAVTETRLKLRVLGLDGCIEKRFSVNAKLSDVAATVHEERSVSVGQFTSSFPRKVFEREDFGLTLSEIGLVPSGVLIVKGKKIQEEEE